MVKLNEKENICLNVKKLKIMDYTNEQQSKGIENSEEKTKIWRRKTKQIYNFEKI
jgi:hypothetical protein